MTLVRSSNTISDQKELENYWASVYLDGDRFDSAEDGIVVTDAGGAIRFSNNTAHKLLGFSVDRARGLCLSEFLTILDESTSLAIADPVARCLDSNSAVILGNYDVMVTHDGVEVPIAGSATPITNANGKCVGAVFVVRDVTPTRLLLRRISYAVPDDKQINLLTRKQFLHRIEQLLGAMSDIHEHALIMVQCKNLPEIESDLGNEAGEVLSSQLVRIFQSELREDDQLAKLGSDDFGILLTHCPRRQAQWIMRRIKQALRHYRLNWRHVSKQLDFRIDILFMYGKDYTQVDRFVGVDSLVYDEDGRQLYS